MEKKVISIIFGSILSVKQDKLFRLLAYSGIPHAGIMLIFIISPLPITSEFLILYFSFYIFSNVGLFICLNSLPKVDKDFVKKLGLNRLFLHATEVELTHPESGRKLRVKAPIPDNLKVVMEKL